MSEAITENITLNAGVLQEQNAAFAREWLVTNGRGGYASGTLGGANTRRYHGLLVAALHPPVGRSVLLSKLEETLTVTDTAGAVQEAALSANLYPGATSPQGYRTLDSWSAYPTPTWTWTPLPGVRFEKRVWQAHGQNTTYVAYRLLAAPKGSVVTLNLVPLLAWKDYHSEMHAGGQIEKLAWTAPKETMTFGDAPLPGTLCVTLPGVHGITPGAFDLTLRLVEEGGAAYPGATFGGEADWYYRFQHPREQERGLDYEEDLYAPGTFTVPLTVGETVVVVASVEAAPEPPQAAWKTRTARQAELRGKVAGADAFAQELARAADQFLVEVPGVRSTVIAGYHWFSDWGRDTMIALPGLCLPTGRAALARDVLLSFAAYVAQGMLPNRFPDKGETPEYNTVDATLWYFVAIYRYVEATGDTALVQDALWNVLEEIVRYHQQGTRYNIHVDPSDGLLAAGQPGVQLTWMDAKVGDWVVTPRIGKPVEINALWINALRTMAHFAEQIGRAEAVASYNDRAAKAVSCFQARYPRPYGDGLYDVLDTPDNNQPDVAVRPNQVFAVSLPFAPLEPTDPLAASVVETVESELLTPVGLRTLSPHDPNYRPHYGGDQMQRDGAYHQGTVWPWLLGPFAEAHFKVRGDRAAALALFDPLHAHLWEYGVGSICEIFDGDPPHRPNGCIAQAWSVAETLRVRQWLRSKDNG